MKLSTIIGASVVILTLGVTVPATAQRDRYGDHGRASRGERGEHGNGRHEQHGNSERRDHAETREGRGPERREVRRDEQHWSGKRRREPEHGHYQVVDRPERRDFDHSRDIWQRNRAEHWEREHHRWRERGGYRGYRIPEDRFRAHFGRGHWFRVHSVPVIVVERYPRFQYAGFWFTLVDPWPETWSEKWYQNDDVYVDYINDGYYMCNRSHPGVFIAVNVSM